MELWQRKVIEAQRTVTEHNPQVYYLERYKSDEPFYWYFTPEMILNDSKNFGNAPLDILDIGCGYGTLLAYSQSVYPKANLYGIDMNRYISDDLKTHLGVKFEQMDIEKRPIPFEDVRFDIVIMTEILEHLKYNPVPTLSKIRERMTPDGILYLSTPDAAEWGRLDKFYNHIGEMPGPESTSLDGADEHIYQYSVGELLRVLDDAGFRITGFQTSQPPYWGAHTNLKATPKN